MARRSSKRSRTSREATTETEDSNTMSYEYDNDNDNISESTTTSSALPSNPVNPTNAYYVNGNDNASSFIAPTARSAPFNTCADGDMIISEADIDVDVVETMENDDADKLEKLPQMNFTIPSSFLPSVDETSPSSHFSRENYFNHPVSITITAANQTTSLHPNTITTTKRSSTMVSKTNSSSSSASSTSRYSILDLSTELVGQVTSLLSQPDLISFYRSCKHIHACINKSWSKLIRLRWPYVKLDYYARPDAYDPAYLTAPLDPAQQTSHRRQREASSQSCSTSSSTSSSYLATVSSMDYSSSSSHDFTNDEWVMSRDRYYYLHRLGSESRVVKLFRQAKAQLEKDNLKNASQLSEYESTLSVMEAYNLPGAQPGAELNINSNFSSAFKIIHRMNTLLQCGCVATDRLALEDAPKCATSSLNPDGTCSNPDHNPFLNDNQLPGATTNSHQQHPSSSPTCLNNSSSSQSSSPQSNNANARLGGCPTSKPNTLEQFLSPTADDSSSSSALPTLFLKAFKTNTPLPLLAPVPLNKNRLLQPQPRFYVTNISRKSFSESFGVEFIIYSSVTDRWVKGMYQIRFVENKLGADLMKSMGMDTGDMDGDDDIEDVDVDEGEDGREDDEDCEGNEDDEDGVSNNKSKKSRNRNDQQGQRQRRQRYSNNGFASEGATRRRDSDSEDEFEDPAPTHPEFQDAPSEYAYMDVEEVYYRAMFPNFVGLSELLNRCAYDGLRPYYTGNRNFDDAEWMELRGYYEFKVVITAGSYRHSFEDPRRSTLYRGCWKRFHHRHLGLPNLTELSFVMDYLGYGASCPEPSEPVSFAYASAANNKRFHEQTSDDELKRRQQYTHEAKASTLAQRAEMENAANNPHFGRNAWGLYFINMFEEMYHQFFDKFLCGMNEKSDRRWALLYQQKNPEEHGDGAGNSPNSKNPFMEEMVMNMNRNNWFEMFMYEKMKNTLGRTESAYVLPASQLAEVNAKAVVDASQANKRKGGDEENGDNKRRKDILPDETTYIGNTVRDYTILTPKKVGMAKLFDLNWEGMM